MPDLRPPFHVACAIGFFAALTVLAFWSSSPLDFIAPAPFVFCLVCAIALGFALRARDVLLATYLIQVGLAYSFSSVLASKDGASVLGLASSGGSVGMGLLLSALFVSVVCATALGLRQTRPVRPTPESPDSSACGWGAALLLLTATTVAAFETGQWTFYTGGEVVAQPIGGIHLEMLYPYLLTALLLLTWRAIVDRWGETTRVRGTVHLWALLAILVVLEAALQMRRLMVTTIIIDVLYLALAQQRRRFHWSLAQKLAAVGALTVVAFATTTGSALWREAAIEYGDVQVSITERLRLMGEGVQQALENAGFLERLTYTGLNAAVVHYYDAIAGTVSLGEYATSSAVAAIPGVIFPWKYDASGAAAIVTCEAAFAQVGVALDLPCTPEADALLAGGPLAVVFVAALWGAFLAGLSRLLQQRAFLPNLLAMVAFVPMSIIEASAFPMFMSLRLIVLIGGAVWVGARVALVFSPRTFRAGRKLSYAAADRRRIAASRAHREQPAAVALARPRHNHD